METNAEYRDYVSMLSNLQPFEGRKKYQTPYASDFEKIFVKAQDANVNLDNAKTFLQSLSKSELVTLQKYTSLAEAIDVGVLSDEGAYNLLMHDNEKYDFNNDGLIQDGIGNCAPIIPKSMPKDVAIAFIDALNTMDERDKLMAMTLTFDISRLISEIQGKHFQPPIMDYSYINTRIDQILNPIPPAFASDELKISIKKFKEAFEASYSAPKTNAENEYDSVVDEFLEELREKGTANLLFELNLKKIETRIDAYKEKLSKEYGNSPEALKEIDKQVNEYKKQLLEQLQNSVDNKHDEIPQIDVQTMIKLIVHLSENKENEPLQEILKDIQ